MIYQDDGKVIYQDDGKVIMKAYEQCRTQLKVEKSSASNRNSNVTASYR